MKVELGSKIRQARKAKGYSQEQLAELAEIAPNYLGEVERGQKMPRMDVFVRIIKALDVSADYILRDELPSGKEFVYDDVTRKMDKLDPKQRKIICDIIDVYVKNVL